MTETGATVLFVDDDDAILSLGRLVLERAGYAVITAGTGGEALKHFTGADPAIDLVLLDHRIPDLSGVEILGRIRDTSPEVAVILSSGCEVPGLSEEDPDVTFLPKPYAPGDLVTAVASALPPRRRRSA